MATKTIPIHRAWLGEDDCRLCDVRRSALFAGLEEADFSHIHQPIEDILLQPQARLYRSGETGRSVFTLRSGLIKLIQYLPDGGQRIVRLQRSGDTLGLEALVGAVHPHDAVALTECQICAIPVAVVEQLGQEQPRLHRELMVRWQQALNEADAWLTQFSTGTARQRVARFLLRLAEPAGERPVRLIGREDLGAILGLTTETASRMVAEMRRQQVLREVRPNLLTCDRQALERIAFGE